MLLRYTNALKVLIGLFSKLCELDYWNGTVLIPVCMDFILKSHEGSEFAQDSTTFDQGGVAKALQRQGQVIQTREYSKMSLLRRLHVEKFANAPPRLPSFRKVNSRKLRKKPIALQEA
jgi:hypothetical protein